MDENDRCAIVEVTPPTQKREKSELLIEKVMIERKLFYIFSLFNIFISFIQLTDVCEMYITFMMKCGREGRKGRLKFSENVNLAKFKLIPFRFHSYCIQMKSLACKVGSIWYIHLFFKKQKERGKEMIIWNWLIEA